MWTVIGGGRCRSMAVSARRTLDGFIARRLLQTRTAVAVAQVTVDDRKDVQTVIEELEQVSARYSKPVELVTQGQLGIVTALHALAGVRQNSLAPAFLFASAKTAARLRGVEGAASSNAKPGVEDDEASSQKSSSPGRSFVLTVPQAMEWVSPDQRQVDSRLLVSNSAKIQPLSKALAARSGLIPEGRAIVVETALIGTEKLRRYRISWMAHAISRVHHWQMCPVNPELPTRPFTCVAEIEKRKLDKPSAGQEDECWVLQVAVIPEGPPKRTNP